MQVDTRQALESKALAVFTNLLKHSTTVIRAKAARDIFDIWYLIIFDYVTQIAKK